MNTETIETIEETQEVHQAVPVSSLQPIKFSVTDQAIAEMKDRFMPLTIAGPDDKAGFQAVYEARMIVKRSRVDVDKKRKELNEDALKHQRKVNGEAQRITALLGEIETHLEKEEKAYNDERERIANEKAEAERQRYQGRVFQLKDWGFVFDDVAEVYQLNGVFINKDDIRDFADDEYAPTLELAQQTYQAEQQRLADEKLKGERAEQRIKQLRALGFEWNAEEELYKFVDAQQVEHYDVCPLDIKNLDEEGFAPILSTAQRVHQDEQDRLAEIKRKNDLEAQRIADEQAETARKNKEEADRLQAIADQQAADQKAIDDQRKQLEDDRRKMIFDNRGPQLITAGFEWNGSRFKLLNVFRLGTDDVVDMTDVQFADLLIDAKAKIKEEADAKAENDRIEKKRIADEKRANKERVDRLKPDKKVIKNHLLKVFEKPSPVVSEPESTEFLKQLYDKWDEFTDLQFEAARSIMKTFLLNGFAINEGDTLTITAPELGTVEVSTTLQPFSNGIVVGLQLDWVNNPSGCLATAKLSLYSNGQNYHTLQLAYHCSCAHNVHPRSLIWVGLQFSQRYIEVNSAKKEDRKLPFQNLPPVPKPASKPVIIEEKEANVGRHGQFKLF